MHNVSRLALVFGTTWQVNAWVIGAILSVILVANAAPGAQVVRALDRMGWAVPVISHWGISGGRFVELGGPSASKVHFVQTYSFFGKLNPVGERVLAALKKKYPAVKGPEDIFAPSARPTPTMPCICLAWPSPRPA